MRSGCGVLARRRRFRGHCPVPCACELARKVPLDEDLRVDVGIRDAELDRRPVAGGPAVSMLVQGKVLGMSPVEPVLPGREGVSVGNLIRREEPVPHKQIRRVQAVGRRLLFGKTDPGRHGIERDEVRQDRQAGNRHRLRREGPQDLLTERHRVGIVAFVGQRQRIGPRDRDADVARFSPPHAELVLEEAIDRMP